MDLPLALARLLPVNGLTGINSRLVLTVIME